ncbi:MAG TPA: inorganic diphosphatase [Clostridiaceae bacterium]|nr:inorganic diphosphatase [Clostridiaceae bacterium]
MNNIDYLDKTLEIKIDRPLGSKHPKHGFIYPVNYGYVPNTISGDGEELDCYVLGIHAPLETFKGKCIAIIQRLNDNDDKLIIVPENKSFSNNEIRVLTEFQEQYFKSEIIRSSNYLEFNKNIPELSVTNLENSLNFYKTAGFKIEYDRPENKFAFISLGEIQFMLQEISDTDKWDVAPLSYPFGNGINFQLEVENIDEIYNSFKNSNYKITFDIEENWYRQDNRLLGNKEFLIQDPDGYLLRFSEDLGEKEI